MIEILDKTVDLIVVPVGVLFLLFYITNLIESRLSKSMLQNTGDDGHE